MSRDFRPPFFHDSTPFGPLINRLKYFRFRFRFRWEIFDHTVISAVWSTPLRSKFFLITQHFILQIFSFMLDLFTTKRISSDCLFKSNHRKVKKSILFPQCAVYIRSMLHTGEITLWSNISAKSKPNSKIL